MTGSLRAGSGQAVIPAEGIASSALFRLNLILTFLVLVVLAGYIFLSNFLVSQRYNLGLRKQQFNQLSAKLPAGGTAAESGVYNLSDLLLFAQASGMVEARDIGVILEENGVALSEYETIGASGKVGQ